MSEARAQQWSRRFERIEDLIAVHIMNGRWALANKGLAVGRKAYDRWAIEVVQAP